MPAHEAEHAGETVPMPKIRYTRDNDERGTAPCRPETDGTDDGDQQGGGVVGVGCGICVV